MDSLLELFVHVDDFWQALIPTKQLDLVGVALRDTKKAVDKVIKGLKLHS